MSAPIFFSKRCLWALRPNTFYDPAVSALLSARMQRQMRRCNMKGLSTPAVLSSHDEHKAPEHAKKNVQSPTFNVAIFWDFENCAVPMESTATRLSALYQLAQTLGRKITFKVYMDHEHAGATATRLALCSAGLELIDCPHGGMKEVIDKAIIVDMFEYALDNPAPSTVVLISGDRGYASALSRLSWRGYHVVIIAPAAAKDGLRLARCHAMYEWSDKLTLVHSEQTAPSTRHTGTLAASVQCRSAVASTPLQTNKRLPETMGFFSAAPKPAAAENPQASNSKTVNTHGSARDTSTLSCILNIVAVRPAFQTLVDVLAVKQKVDGAIYVSISELGRLLRKTDPNVYEKAGVSGTKEYALLAESENVIVFQTNESGLVKVGAEIFVGLHPRLLSSCQEA